VRPLGGGQEALVNLVDAVEYRRKLVVALADSDHCSGAWALVRFSGALSNV
jgi:hypothetical protein